MNGRSPARLLAPLALVVSAVALFVVIGSGGGESGTGASSTAAPTETPTPAAKARKQSKQRSAAKTYTVKSGDTPSSIAQANGVEVDALLEANPDADPGALSVGQKLKLP